jgi:hypothetical protein
MARIIPALSEAELAKLDMKNSAEATVYRACQDLPPSWVVLYSLRTLLIEENEGARDREGDFVVLHPGLGLLVIEVKGGNVLCKEGRWIQRLAGVDKPLSHDPFDQATSFKHALITRMKVNILWDQVDALLGEGRLLARHAVLLPQVKDASAVRAPHVEGEVVGGAPEVSDLEAWIERALNFGSTAEPWSPLTVAGVKHLTDILSAPFSTRPILGFVLQEAEEQRIFLTLEQYNAALQLYRHKRVAIAGGAGTGKTVLAFQHARDCARVGLRTLLLCYNRPLADHLRRERERFGAVGEPIDGLRVDTFDRFARWWLNEAKQKSGIDYLQVAGQDLPSADEHTVLLPTALQDALAEHPLSEPYDVVLVDEGQDFGDLHWAALKAGVIQRAAHRFAVFFDSNQAIYRRANTFPIPQDQVVELTKNCRNTDPIHGVAYASYRGPPSVEPSRIQGDEVVRWTEAGVRAQAELMARHIHDWVTKEQVQPEKVAVLLLCLESVPTEAEGVVRWKQLDAGVQNRLGRTWQAALRALDRVGVSVSLKSYWQPGQVLMDWVGRYKGLEADVVILWANGVPDGKDRIGLRYVACSRAKSKLVLLGSEGHLSLLFPP